jgi:hypothetical protein
MQIIVKIAFIAIGRIVNRQFIPGMDVSHCAILCHYIYKNPVIDKKENSSMHIVTNVFKNSQVSFKMAKDILEFRNSYSNKGYHDFYQTFNILYAACHWLIISQNFVECKHNVKKKTNKK